MQRLILIVVALLLAVPSAGGVQAQQVPDPLFNVEPKAGGPGTRFAFMATGFLGLERVDVWLNDPDGNPRDLRAEHLDPATGFGRVDWFWTAPSSIRAGSWQAVARGRQSGVQRIIPFEIGGAPGGGQPGLPVATPGGQPGVDYNVEPKLGGSGTRFAFVAFGFKPDEEVGVWLNTPDGQPLPARAEHLDRATSQGRVDWYWTAPPGLRAGTWQMLVLGKRSGVQRIIPFQLR